MGIFRIEFDIASYILFDTHMYSKTFITKVLVTAHPQDEVEANVPPG